MPNESVVLEVPASEILKNDVSLPLEPALLSPAQRMLKDIEDMTIDADPMYGIAGDELKRIKGAYNKLEAERIDLTRPLDEVKKKIMARYAKPLEVLAAAEAALKSKMLSYHTEKERIAAQERHEAEEAARIERERLAREAAEIERKAQEAAAAERARVDAEARAAREKAEVEAKALADSGRAKEAEEARARAERAAVERAATARVAEREALERAEREADERRQTAAVVVAAPSVTEAPIARGTAITARWKARVTNKSALIKFIASTPQYENLLDVNDAALNQLARALKQNLKLEGVEAFEERGMSSRAA